jgi:hypothetical protein
VHEQRGEGKMVKKIGLIGCSLLLFLFFRLDARKSANNLEKAFHYTTHQASIQGQAENINIDLGRVVLLFSPKKPVMNLVPKKQYSANNMEKRDVYLFPFSTIASENCKKMVQKLNQIQGRFYKLHLQVVSKPIAGLRLSITYNPGKVLFDYRFFETISSSQGIEFRFYDKKLLEKLGNKLNTATRVSCVKKKESLLLIAGMEEKIQAPWGFLA